MRIMQCATVVGFGAALAAGVATHVPVNAADLADRVSMIAPAPSDVMAAAEKAMEAEPPQLGAAVVTPSPGTFTGMWAAGVECLYGPGEPRALSSCIPPPPCHPSNPPNPYDLVGVAGVPTDGPIYRGPCEPRTGTHDDRHFWRLHRLNDRFFDWFYRAK